MGWERHSTGVARLEESYDALPPGAPVRLAKRTSNLFRGRAQLGAGLDVSGLDGVIEVDGDIAEVQGMCTYEDLVEVTLASGRIPLVVPQLRTITLGGAVTGLGIESTSFRNGLPHESVLEMDVLTGAGEIVTTKPGDALFDAFPNSYGSLGYATRLRIELEQVPSFVALRHVRFDDAPSSTMRATASASDGASSRTARGRGSVSTGSTAWRSLPTSSTSRSHAGPTSRARPATTPASRSSSARFRSARATC